jgi:hypothetical protein
MNKVTLQEGQEAVDRVKLLMNYSLKNTLNENLALVMEQKPDEMMPGQIERFGFKAGQPETLKPALKKQEKYIEDFGKLTFHDWIMIAQLGLAFLPGGVVVSGGIKAATMVALGLADAYKYYTEGDKNKAGVMGALEILMALYPTSGVVKRIMHPVSSLFEGGMKGVLALKNKVIKQGAEVVLTKEEKMLMDLVGQNQQSLATEAKNLVKKVGKTTAKGTGKVVKAAEPVAVYSTALSKGESIDKSKKQQNSFILQYIKEMNPSIKDVQTFEVINDNLVVINNKKYEINPDTGILKLK